MSTQSTQIPLPNLLLIGVAKCGTTSLCKMLSAHPEICFAEEKEVPFFALEPLWEKGIDHYLSHFSHYRADQHKYIGEGSPHYTRTYHNPQKCFQRISSVISQCKFIFMVRDPIARITSDIHHRKLMNQPGSELPIQEMILTQDFLIKDSCYYSLLRPYIEFYGLDQIHVLSLEVLLQDHDQTWSTLCNFLGIEPITVKLGSENISSQRRRLPRSISALRGNSIGKLLPKGLKRWALSLLEKPVSRDRIDPELTHYILDIIAEDITQFRSIFPQVPDYLATYA